MPDDDRKSPPVMRSGWLSDRIYWTDGSVTVMGNGGAVWMPPPAADILEDIEARRYAREAACRS